MQEKENFSILLVDDDLMVIRILNCILSDFAPLRFATSGRDALNGVGGWGHGSEILGCGWLEFINAAAFMIASTPPAPAVYGHPYD